MIKRVTSSTGWRRHIISDDCWCRPVVESRGGIETTIHSNPMVRGDNQERMTCFSGVDEHDLVDQFS